MEALQFTPNVLGQFGLEREAMWPCTFGANEKGGMDKIEFEKYLRTAIMPLYPNAEPEKGKWVILNCDSGPGRENVEGYLGGKGGKIVLFPPKYQ